MQLNQFNKQMTKKEQYEMRRKKENEFSNIQQKQIAYKRIIKWIGAIIFLGFVGYGFFSFILQQIETQEVGQSIPIQGREHIQIDESHLAYNSNPPTSGPHYGQEVEWGIYQEELPDEQVVHSLEHGGIWISYQPDIDEGAKEKIEAIGKKYLGSVVVSPRSSNDSLIALASWGRLEKLSFFDEQSIIEFIKNNKNKSPEPLAR